MKFDRWLWKYNASVWSGFDSRRGFRVVAQRYTVPWDGDYSKIMGGKWKSHKISGLNENEVPRANLEAWAWLSDQWIEETK